MGRINTTSLLLLSIWIMAYQCRHSPVLKMALLIDIQINPNPVIRNNNLAEFELEVNIDPEWPGYKSDSVKLEISYFANSQHYVIGNMMLINSDIKDNSRSHQHKVDFRVGELPKQDSIPLDIQMFVYKRRKVVPTIMVHYGNIVY